ncbi:MAG TPA: phosphoglucosamine mutase, partial [Clostridiales bacterium]|nr:phosphoglucosamine mutase [Clostridiales bacterium]
MQYFGTDGIRQKADFLLSNRIPFLLGKALSQSGAKVIVARDVRAHSKDIEKQLCKGLLEGTAQIWLAGVLPTPALAYTAQT